MNTIIPAQPGFFVFFPDGKKVPVIAWKIGYDGYGELKVLPITPKGLPAAGGEVAYLSNPEWVGRRVQL